nr:hypothetical protein [uncultured Rhodoferax sp.]
MELSFDGIFELRQSDCDVLVQLTSKSYLWQKERLLNVALDRLPDFVDHVAWIDCDVIFEDQDWPDKAVDNLRDMRLVQLFSRLYDLPIDVLDPALHPNLQAPFGLPLMAAIASSGNIEEHLKPSNGVAMRRSGSGLAWAAHADFMQQRRFYDAMIIGSGDRAMACAGFGRFNYPIEMFRMNPRRTEHYLEWATPYHHAVDSRMSYLEGNLFHLWHGDVVDRNYAGRHLDLDAFAFDPYTDLVLGQSGAWEWNNRPDLQNFSLEYFRSRKEDGR